jgi:prepilin signal peptidase PulO-like enzyme (type II secretory pathway)
MIYILYIFIFLFGLAIGSFINVLADRLPQEKSILGRSVCDRCGRQLFWLDLVPLLSFFVFGRKCRTCRQPISWQYPLVEMACGFLFLFVFYFFTGERVFLTGLLADVIFFIYLFFIVSCLLAIFVADLKYYIIPDKIIFPAILAAFFYRIFEFFSAGRTLGGDLFTQWQPLSIYILSAAGAATFFLFLVLITRGKGMGLGDVKLAILMGLILGWPGILLALFLSFGTGAIFGLTLIFTGKKTMQSQIPFGPFLVGATFLVLLFGDKMLRLVFSAYPAMF